MGSIPLVALAVHPPDPLQNAQGAMSLRALGQQTQQQAALAPGQLQAQKQGLQAGQQESQLRQQAIQQGEYANQDREAGLKAMQQWSGKDLNELPDLIQKNGGSLNAVLGARKSAIEAQQSVLNLNNAQLTNSKTKNDYLLGKLQAATDPNVPDAQLPQSIMAATQDAVKDGYLDPPHAQEMQQLIQQFPNPADLRSHLAIYEKGLQSQSEQFAQEQKRREVGAAETTATARATSADTQAKELAAKMPGGPLNAVTQKIQEETDPRIIAAKAQEAQNNITATMRARQQMYPSALAGVAPQLVTPATADATKADQQFTQAQQAGNEMQSMVRLAKSGNKVAYAYSPVTGVLQINVAGQIKRVNMPEIESYGGAGSAVDRVKAFIGKQTEGASIPDNILNDMDSVSKMVTQGAKDKYEQDISGINSRYGAKFEPMTSKGGAQGGGQPQTGAPIPKPENATHTGVSSVDGKTYWLDKDQKKLGLAQ